MTSRVMYGAGPDGKGWWIQGGRNHELEALAADLLQKLFDRESEHEVELSEWKELHKNVQTLLGRARAAIDVADHGTYCSSRIPVPEGPKYSCDCWKSKA